MNALSVCGVIELAARKAYVAYMHGGALDATFFTEFILFKGFFQPAGLSWIEVSTRLCKST